MKKAAEEDDEKEAEPEKVPEKVKVPEKLTVKQAIKKAKNAVDSTLDTLDKGRKLKLKNGDDYDTKKDPEVVFPKKSGSKMIDSTSDSDDHDEFECHGECLRYKYLYNHLKKQHEKMHNSVNTYDPEKEHPEIMEYHKKHHYHNHHNHADDFDTDDKKDGKKSAARDF